jgi:pimeloyl-ACP methyl ester carboxylesterase
MAFVSIRELELAYRLRKAGPESIVFIHGLGTSRNAFNPCFEMEAFRSYTLASVDLPGCGESSRPDHFSYTMRDQADLLLDWIRVLELNDVILVGHSMGGVICLYLAEWLGKRVRAFFNLEGNLEPADCIFSGEIASSTWDEFRADGFDTFKKKLEGIMRRAPSPGLEQYYKDVTKADLRAIYYSSVSLVKESHEGGLREKFLAMQAAKWYVFGAQSMSQASVDFLETSGIPYLVVPESGHFMMDDQPGQFYGMLHDAINDLR